MANKAIITVDDTSVDVNSAQLFKEADGKIYVEFGGTVDKISGAGKHHLTPVRLELTGATRTTVISFFTNTGIPALKTANGI